MLFDFRICGLVFKIALFAYCLMSLVFAYLVGLRFIVWIRGFVFRLLLWLGVICLDCWL